MRFTFAPILLIVSTISAVAATAQQHGTSAQRATNGRAIDALYGRIETLGHRIHDGQRSGLLMRARVATLRRQVAQTQASVTRLSRRQGFVSAGELASYNRTLRAIGMELDRRGVASGSHGQAGGEAGGFRFNCQNDPIAIAIPGDRLDRSIEQLTLITHCPISGTNLTRGKRSKPVVGTMTPTAALQAMLDGTGLQMSAIRGGFQIVSLRR